MAIPRLIFKTSGPSTLSARLPNAACCAGQIRSACVKNGGERGELTKPAGMRIATTLIMSREELSWAATVEKPCSENRMPPAKKHICVMAAFSALACAPLMGTAEGRRETTHAEHEEQVAKTPDPDS